LDHYFKELDLDYYAYFLKQEQKDTCNRQAKVLPLDTGSVNSLLLCKLMPNRSPTSTGYYYLDYTLTTTGTEQL